MITLWRYVCGGCTRKWLSTSTDRKCPFCGARNVKRHNGG